MGTTDHVKHLRLFLTDFWLFTSLGRGEMRKNSQSFIKHFFLDAITHIYSMFFRDRNKRWRHNSAKWLYTDVCNESIWSILYGICCIMIQNNANQYLGSDQGLRIKILKNENIEKLVFFPKNDKTFIKKILFIEIFFLVFMNIY